MANAFLLRPLPMTPFATYGTVLAGQLGYTLNDYAGVVCKVACDGSGNSAGLRFDLGSDVEFDTVMAFGVNDFPGSGVVWVAYATSAAPSTLQTLKFVQPYAGGFPRVGGGVAIATGETTVTARYVQLNFNAPSSGQSVAVSRIVVGKRFRPAIGFEYGAQFGVRDLGSLDVSARGVLLRRRGQKLRTVALSFSSLTKVEAEWNSIRMLEQIGNTECIALCTDPSDDYQLQNRCYYGPLIGDLTHTWASSKGWELRANLLGLM